MLCPPRFYCSQIHVAGTDLQPPHAGARKLYFTSLPYTKTSFKWVVDLNVKGKAIQFLEENIGEYFSILGIRKAFLDLAFKIVL